MAKKRKVNAPVREKKRQQQEEAERRRLRDLQRKAGAAEQERKERAAAIAQGLEEPGARPAPGPTFSGPAQPMPKVASFAITIGVFLLIAAVIVGAIFAFKAFQPKEDPTPWKSYQERIEVTATPSGPEKKYQYRERELKNWIAGVKNKEVRQSEFENIVSIAARWLTLEDATKVVLAAAGAHPEWKSSVAPHAAKLMDLTKPADPASRELRNQLKAIAESSSEKID